MKKIVFILFVLPLFSFNMLAQENKGVDNQKIDKNKTKKCRKGSTKVFELDLAVPHKNALKTVSNCKSKGLSVHTTQPIAFILKNSNPLKYRYELKCDLVNIFDSEQENPLAKVQKNYFSKINKAETQVGDESEEETSDQSKEKIEELEQEIKRVNDNAGKKELKLKSLALQLEEFKKEKEKVQSKLTDLETKLSIDTMFLSTNKLFVNKALSRTGINALFDKSQNQIVKYESLVQEFDQEIEKYEEQINDKKSYYELRSLQKELNKLRLEEEHKEIENRQKQIDIRKVSFKLKVMTQRVGNVSHELIKFLTKASTEDHLNRENFIYQREKFEEDYQQIINEINTISNEATETRDTVFISNYNAKVKTLDKTQLSEMENVLDSVRSLKWDHYKISTDFNGKNIDIVQISLIRYLKSGSSEDKADEYLYNIWVKGGIKIDVSAGAFITSLVNRKYTISNKTRTVGQDNEETYQVITQDNPGHFQYGFGSMLNISPRCGVSWIKPTYNIGALFTSDQKFQFLTGFGLVLGKEQRIILHGGLSMGAIISLANNYKADGQSRYNLGEAVSPPTQEKFSFGHFFGVTYNLGKVKSQKDIKNK